MPKYWKELDWPDTPNLQHLIDRIDEFPEYLHNQNGVENYSQAVNLKEWPTIEQDLGNIIPSNIDLKLVSLQRVLPPGLPWHIDRNRSVAAINILKGNAYTVFQEPKKPMQRVEFKFNKWYIFNGFIPHCVKKCMEPRLAVCVDLSQIYENYETACNELLS